MRGCGLCNIMFGFSAKTKEGRQHYSRDIHKILGKYEKVFGKIPPGPPLYRVFELTIELEEGAKPIITTPYQHTKRFK
jgi:hypothetical protein